VVFSANILVPDPVDSRGTPYTYFFVDPSIYRARPDSLERVIGPGDVTADGQVVNSLLWNLDGRSALFDSNPSGDVLAGVSLGAWPYTSALVVRRPDGTMDRLALSLENGWSQEGIGVAPTDLPDYLFLSGLGPMPTLPQVATVHTSASPLRSTRLGRDTSAEGNRYFVTDVRLTDSGAVVMLATERVCPWSDPQICQESPEYESRVLRLENGALEQLFTTGQLILEATENDLYDLHVAGERFGFASHPPSTQTIGLSTPTAPATTRR
jgi:hypothetical protein